MRIDPDYGKLRYSGRIDFTDKKAPVMVFPCSYIAFRFTGNRLRVMVENGCLCQKSLIACTDCIRCSYPTIVPRFV